MSGAVIDYGAIFKYNCAHIVSCLVNSQGSSHICNSIVVGSIACKTCSNGVFTNNGLSVVFVRNGYTVGKSAFNSNRDSRAVVDNGAVFKYNCTHIVGSLFNS